MQRGGGGSLVIRWSLVWKHLQKMGLPQLQCCQKVFPNTVLKYEWEFSEISPIWLMDRKQKSFCQIRPVRTVSLLLLLSLLISASLQVRLLFFIPILYAQEPFGLVIFYPSTRCPQIMASFLYQFLDTPNRPLPLFVPYCTISFHSFLFLTCQPLLDKLCSNCISLCKLRICKPVSHFLNPSCLPCICLHLSQLPEFPDPYTC